MAFVPYTLKSAQTFTRNNSNQTVRVESGTVVQREQTETATHTIHQFRITRDGSYWYATVTIPKPVTATPVPVPDPTPAPVLVAAKSNHVSNAVNATAKQTSKQVLAIAQKEGLNVITGDSDELKVRRLQRIHEVLAGEVYSVNYYIPSRLAKKVGQKHIAIFRRHAFHLDGSNWIFSAKGLEAKEVKEVLAFWDQMKPIENEGGIPGFRSRTKLQYWIRPCTKDQLAREKEQVMEQLSEALQETHRKLIKRIDGAYKALQEAQEALGPNPSSNAMNEVQQQHATRYRSIITDACTRYESCLRGAEIFDDTGSLDAMFEALREIVYVRALACNAMLQAKALKEVKIPEVISTPGVPLHSINPSNLPKSE